MWRDTKNMLWRNALPQFHRQTRAWPAYPSIFHKTATEKQARRLEGCRVKPGNDAAGDHWCPDAPLGGPEFVASPPHCRHAMPLCHGHRV